MIKFYTKLIQRLAKRYIARHQPLVIGVTGSAGKSSAVTAIGTVLRQLLPDQKVYFPSKQLNGELGLPLTIFQVEYFGPTIKYALTTLWKVIKQYISQTKPYDIIVLEYAVDHLGEMDLLLDIVVPDFAVITNIDQVHFGDPTITRQEKSKLIKAVKKKGYLPLQEATRDNKRQQEIERKLITFAIHNKQADIDLINHEFLLDNPAQAGLGGDVLIGDDVVEIVTNGIEYFYLVYAALGYDIARMLGCVSIKQLAVYFDLPPSRATLLPGICQSLIIDSSYNSSPVGTYHMIDIVQEMRTQFPEYRIICLMGEMRELYEQTEESHRQLAQKLIDLNTDYIGLVGESAHNYMLESLVDHYGQDRVMYSPDSRTLGDWIKTVLEQDTKKTIILVKGSQNTIYLEEAIKILLANPDDVVRLCRQSDRRMIKKDTWFRSLTS